MTWDLGSEFTPTGLHFISHLPVPETVVNIHPKLHAVCMYGTVCICSSMPFCRFAPRPALLFDRSLINSQKPLPIILPNTVPHIHFPPNFLTLSNSQTTPSSVSWHLSLVHDETSQRQRLATVLITNSQMPRLVPACSRCSANTSGMNGCRDE